MPQFAANLSMMYQEYPFLQRFAAAAQDGFKAVEYLFPYEFSAQELRDALDASGLQQVLFNAPPGDWAAGERGIAALPGREAEFRLGFDQALSYAEVLGNPYIHVMAGIVEAQQDHERCRAVYQRNLAYAALHAARHEKIVLIEPINTRDMPGYFLNMQEDAQQICHEIGVENLQLQFDIYHCQIMQGDVTIRMLEGLRRQEGQIAHIQIAGVPGRQEPSLGELNYPYLFAQLDAAGYAGWIGCEYRPAAGTSAGLDWLRPYLKRD
ncbi:2-oxo-tetronate isomerase [Undibacterium rugosum]|uniref:2-oxo-tetronate isomerase n=1 Tax=Undibacterium rugosum TaxID=2762291 RepID=UPI001B840A91|nr:2-oxo-tetronate isomerase [Undibacterium rugosum]MBR7777341.1 hydroxypyruvate isomerase family protein [Undibacterium rugosum]